MRPFAVTITAFASLLSLSLAQEAAKPDAKQDPATKPELHKGTDNKIAKYNEVSKKGEAEVVFLGDSITEGWNNNGKAAWAEHFAPMKAVNFGIGGDRTEHVLYRMDQGNLDGLKPKAVVIMIGTNNTGHRMGPADATAAGVKAIVDGVLKKCPDTKILLLAIFPRGENATEKRRVRNEEINALIAKLADDKKVFYKNINEKFLEKDGSLSKKIMPDLLHLSPEGYAIWANSIKEDLQKLVK